MIRARSRHSSSQLPPSYQRATIPLEKGLLFRTSTHKGNPEGRSILGLHTSPIYLQETPSRFIEGIGIERDPSPCLPYRMGSLLPRSSERAHQPPERQVLEQIKRIITNIRRDEQEGIVFPLAYDGGRKQAL